MGNFGGAQCQCRSFLVRDKTKKLRLPLSAKGLKEESSSLPQVLGGPCPVGDRFLLGPPFCIHPLSSRPLSGPTDSVALRIGDLTVSCHGDHCDVTSRGQVVQGGVEGGNARLELRDIRGFCPTFHAQKRKCLEVDSAIRGRPDHISLCSSEPKRPLRPKRRVNENKQETHSLPWGW